MIKLRQLGFDLEGGHGAWDVLGVAKLEGPAPEKGIIERRSDTAALLLGAVTEGRLEPEERATRAQWVAKVGRARDTCLHELKEVLKTHERAAFPISYFLLKLWTSHVGY